jgi:hypothetical protein
MPTKAEASGLALSRRTPGIIWSHNDSGHDAVLYALGSNGALYLASQGWRLRRAGTFLSLGCTFP